VSSGVDVLVITVTEDEERTALKQAFGIRGDVPPPWLVDVPRRKGWRPIRLALDVIGLQGGTSAASFTGDRLRRFSPTAAVLVGTCGGRRGKVDLNHVVISDLVIEYQREVRVRGDPRRRPIFSVPPYGLLSQLTEFNAGGRVDWLSRWKQLVSAIPAQRTSTGTHSPGEDLPEVHVAAIAGGELNIRDGSMAELASRFHDRLYAVEMEGHGFARACYMEGVPWIVVRGVSDFADYGAASEGGVDSPPVESSHPRTHHLSAALAAACLTRRFLGEIDLSPDRLWGGRGPPLTLTYDFHKALRQSESHQLRARKRVKIVSANAKYDRRFKTYVLATLSRGVKVSRIIDPSRWKPASIVDHIRSTWKYLPREAQEDPKYDLRFAKSGGVGIVLIDDIADPSASFFLYLDGENCLYVETTRPEAIEAARSRIESIARGAPSFRSWMYRELPSKAALLKYVNRLTKTAGGSS
jgi:nucleoside phosphorylase